MIQQKIYSKQTGFSLVEMAVVIVILALVLGALIMPLQAQQDLSYQSQTEATLDQAKKALIGFAQSRGRLPCPATDSSDGIESYKNNNEALGECNRTAGLLPGKTLGIQPTDTAGYVLDAWGNRLHYAVTQDDNNGNQSLLFTTPNAMSTQGVSNLQPSLKVCQSLTGITASKCSASTLETNYLTNNAVTVIYSLGATGAKTATSAVELENLDDDAVFVSVPVTANGEFDHILTWISPYVLYNSMIEAGQLH